MWDSPPHSGEERGLHPTVLVLWRVQSMLTATLVAVPSLVAAGLVPIPFIARAAIVLVAIAVVTLAWWLPGVSFRAWRYRLGATALELRHGVITSQRSVVPYFRVQHVDVSQGPIERRLHLARLKVHTASAGTSGQLPGIEEERAEEIRRLVLDRAEVGDGI